MRYVSYVVAIASICVGCSFFSQGRAYFEHRYFCDVGSSSITVSLKQQVDEKKCFEFISRVAQKIDILDEDISTASGLISAGRDIEYRTQVHQRLQTEREQYDRSRQQLLVAMSDFERELFIRVKGIIYVYLNPRYEELTQKIKKSDELLTLTKSAGTIEQYEFVIQKRDQLYRERLLLETIRSASSFETLMFPLKTYFQDNTLQ